MSARRAGNGMCSPIHTRPFFITTEVVGNLLFGERKKMGKVLGWQGTGASGESEKEQLALGLGNDFVPESLAERHKSSKGESPVSPEQALRNDEILPFLRLV